MSEEQNQEYIVTRPSSVLKSGEIIGQKSLTKEKTWKFRFLEEIADFQKFVALELLNSFEIKIAENFIIFHAKE